MNDVNLVVLLKISRQFLMNINQLRIVLNKLSILTPEGVQPNSRITMRNDLKNHDLSVVLLLDLSESTNESMNGSEKTLYN